MFDPSALTLGQVSSTVRDFSIVGALIVVVWKLRGGFETIVTFLERVTQHMDSMERFAKTVVDNHLKHIEKDIARLARQQVRANDVEMEEYRLADESSPDEVKQV